MPPRSARVSNPKTRRGSAPPSHPASGTSRRDTSPPAPVPRKPAPRRQPPSPPTRVPASRQILGGELPLSAPSRRMALIRSRGAERAVGRPFVVPVRRCCRCAGARRACRNVRRVGLPAADGAPSRDGRLESGRRRPRHGPGQCASGGRYDRLSSTRTRVRSIGTSRRVPRASGHGDRELHPPASGRASRGDREYHLYETSLGRTALPSPATRSSSARHGHFRARSSARRTSTSRADPRKRCLTA